MVVDNVLENITLGLETNDFKNNQRRLAEVKYLGELYNYKMVDSPVIFDSLYRLVTFGHCKSTIYISEECQQADSCKPAESQLPIASPRWICLTISSESVWSAICLILAVCASIVARRKRSSISFSHSSK